MRQTIISDNILALDIGDKRIGVALSGPARLPRPLTTLANDGHIFDKLNQLVKDEEAGVVVVGLPLGMDGQETQQTRTIRAFVTELEKRLPVSIRFQDESVTSKLAEDELSRSTKTYNKPAIDALAATYILEDFLKHDTDLKR